MLLSKLRFKFFVVKIVNNIFFILFISYGTKLILIGGKPRKLDLNFDKFVFIEMRISVLADNRQYHRLLPKLSKYISIKLHLSKFECNCRCLYNTSSLENPTIPISKSIFILLISLLWHVSYLTIFPQKRILFTRLTMHINKTTFSLECI